MQLNSLSTTLMYRAAGWRLHVSPSSISTCLLQLLSESGYSGSTQQAIPALFSWTMPVRSTPATILAFNIVGLFTESVTFGFVIISSAYCLLLLLCHSRSLKLKRSKEVKWWAVSVTLLLAAISTLDMAMSVERNLRAFVHTAMSSDAVEILSDTRSWSYVLKHILYIAQVAIADAVLAFRLYVVWECKRLFAILSVLILFGGAGCAIAIIVLGKITHNIDGGQTGTLEVVLFALDLATNIFAISLIVWKLWRRVASISTNPGRWLIVIRIIVESGALYVLAVLALMVSLLLGVVANCVASTTGQIIAIASNLIFIRTSAAHDTPMHQEPPRPAPPPVHFSPRTNLPRVADDHVASLVSTQEVTHTTRIDLARGSLVMSEALIPLGKQIEKCLPWTSEDSR
ncbi:hypothetical protein NM688_g3875 [Phlebia brevispora]|uniref:Uncharacterized protein n=1 Tax=Phlebia brevispora TaxID=194682 RepID=A0ACC1T4N0_9APHY|nr:hypothetical protein NM688_g3875 [Phlebia brevispora]